MTFAEFRPPVKVLFVLVGIGTALGLYQLLADPPIGPLSAILRAVDIIVALFLIFGIFKKTRAAYWLILATGTLSLASLALKAGFALKMGALNFEIVQYLAIHCTIPVLILCMTATYGVRRHFRLVERRNEN